MIILHVLIVKIFITYAKSSQKAVREDFFGTTWDRAKDACKPHGLENREDYLRSSGIRDDNEFWIGKAIYRVPTRWFEIIGCFYIAENHIHSFPAMASIGYCKQKCDSENMGNYFGYRQQIWDIQTHNCACFPNGIDQIQPRDIQYCLNSTHFLVYKDYNGTVSKSSDPGNCATICCGNCNRITAYENNLEGRRCSSVNNTIVGRCGTRHNSAFIWASDYYGSLDFCRKRNASLPSSNYCQQMDTNGKFKGQISWINVFREEIESIKIKDFDQQPQRCFSGIFITVQGHKQLNMTEQNCNGNKTFICKTNSSIDTATTTQSPLYTFNKSKDENVNTSPDPLLSHGSDKSSFKSTGAVIGGILGACSIFAVSAVLIVCKIRSKGIFKESNTYEKGETSQLHFSNTINQDTTSTRNREINDLCETGASGHSVVNNLTKPENMNETYTDAADGEYDVLHDKKNRRMCPTENVYHSQNEDGPSYDSAAIVKGNHNDGNELYDTSFSVLEGDYYFMSYKSHDNSMTTNIYDKST